MSSLYPDIDPEGLLNKCFYRQVGKLMSQQFHSMRASQGRL